MPFIPPFNSRAHAIAASLRSGVLVRHEDGRLLFRVGGRVWTIMEHEAATYLRVYGRSDYTRHLDLDHIHILP